MSTRINSLLLSNLMEYGLSEKEAKVYISLLEHEVATVNQIAKESGVNRSSVYVVLEMLKKKGLVSMSDEKTTRKYFPVSPEILLKKAEERANLQHKVKENIHSIIPDLKALYKGTKQRPVVRVYEGKDGLMSMFEETLTVKDKTIRVVSNLQNLTGIIPQEFFPYYVKQRMIHKIKMFVIHPDNSVAEYILKMNPSTLDEVVLIPEKIFSSPSDIAVYDNKVSFMTHKNGGTGVLIESNEMAEAMKNMFDLAFRGAISVHGNTKKKSKEMKR